MPPNFLAISTAHAAATSPEATVRFVGVAVFDEESGELIVQTRVDAPTFRAIATGSGPTTPIPATLWLPIPDGSAHRTLLVRREFAQVSGEPLFVEDVKPPLVPAVNPALGRPEATPSWTSALVTDAQQSFVALSVLLRHAQGDAEAAQAYESLKEQLLGSVGGAP